MSIEDNLDKHKLDSTTPASLMTRGPTSLLEMPNASVPQQERLPKAAMGTWRRPQLRA
jgi:hypothetical protein